MKKTSRSRPDAIHVALLGLDHPHSEPLLATLHNLPEIGRVFLWNENACSGHIHAMKTREKVEQFTTDLDALLSREDLDFAILCVPTDQAADMACRVLSSGTHLLVEKPVGLNADEVRKVIRAARKSGRKAGVLYGNRFHPAILEARKQVQSGAIGELLTLEARMVTTQVRFRNPDSWLFSRRLAGGGILTWLGCHHLDLLQYVSGDRITSVFARMETRSGEDIDVEDVAALTLEFQSGAIGTFHLGYLLAHSGGGYVNSAGYDNRMAWNGRLGRVVWRGKPRLLIESPAKTGPAVREQIFRVRKTNSYSGSTGETFMREFIAAVRGQTSLPTSLEDALRTAEIIAAAHQSAKTGKLVRVKSSQATS